MTLPLAALLLLPPLCTLAIVLALRGVARALEDVAAAVREK